MLNRIKIITPGVLFASFIAFYACSHSGGGAKEKQSAYPVTPDSSGYLKLVNYLSEEEIDSVVEIKTTLKNGNKRKKGLIPVPQDGDDFRNAELDRVYWNNVSVVEGDFRGASMRTANCKNSIFNYSDFRVADLRWTWFDHSQLRNCRFSQAKLFHVHVNEAILEGSDFRGANMFGMEGHRTNMRNCDLTHVLLKDAEFTYSDFTLALAVNARLIRAVLSHSRFDSSNFSYCDFTGARLEGASFLNANLENSNFQGSHLQEADFSGANLKGCSFYGARMENTQFKNALNIPKHIKKLIKDDKVSGTIPTQVK